MLRIKRWYKNLEKMDQDMVWIVIYTILLFLSIPMAYIVWRLYDLWEFCKYYPCEYLTWIILNHIFT